MEFTSLKIAGSDALKFLEEYRSRYASTGLYPFLIGGAEELENINECAEFNEEKPEAIIQSSLEIRIADWIADRRMQAEEYEISTDELSGKWPGEIAEKGSIGLHKDLLTGKIKKDAFLGLARIDKPWQLPAVLKYGAWNECPEPPVHCAFHRHWLEKYGAEITGISGDIVECLVNKPPRDREAAMTLAWEQYWYCADIVEQGCGSVTNHAATLLNSPYWFFWWD